MIEHLTGKILHKEEGHVVLGVGGVGYGINVTENAAGAMAAVGEEAELWIYTHVAEGALDLYGFARRGEREVYKVVLGISGVGPKLGLAILSTFTIENMIQIVATGDAKALKAVPGIGLKKAEKLLLELKGRLGRLTASLEPSVRRDLVAIEGGAAIVAESFSGPASEAVSALEALDVPPANARRAVNKALELLGAQAATEALVREGLRHRA